MKHLCQEGFEGQHLRNYNNPHLQGVLPSDWDMAMGRKGPGELRVHEDHSPTPCSILEWKVLNKSRGKLWTLWEIGRDTAQTHGIGARWHL